MAIKPWCTRTFLSLACTCLCIQPWLIFYCTSSHNCISSRPTPSRNCQNIFWAVGSFDGVPSGNSFAKRYELHYQPKTIETPEGDQITQYRCLNFHAKRDGSPMLSPAIRNKWSAGWTKSWLYFRVSCWLSSEDGKSIYAMHS
jgi:hypothetical protein